MELVGALSLSDFLIRCLLSVLLGGVIGLEREYKQKPAGIKTHVLISLGAMALTYLSFHFSLSGDPGRIAAQVVSGIGFIGAGTILQSRQMVQGLTTAATLWMVASVGMLVGAGMYVFAVTITLVAFFFLIFSRLVFRTRIESKNFSVSVDLDGVGALDRFDKLVHQFGLRVHNKTLTRKDNIHIEITYSTPPLNQHVFLKKVLQLRGVGEVIKY